MGTEMLIYLQCWRIKMPSKLLTKEQDEYLRKIAKGKSVQECVDELNVHFGTTFTYNQIKQYKARYNITSGKKSWEFINHSKQKLITNEQDAFIRNHAKGLGNAELTKLFNDAFGTNLTVKQIKGYKKNHHISSGLTGQFKKGCTPLNKGKKMSREVYDKAKPTMFKKGQKPKNTDPIGTEKLLGDGYVWVKIDDQNNVPKYVNWRQKHRLIYEKYHGVKLTKNDRCVFADGDRTNFDISNLILVSNSEMLIMNRNNLMYQDKELTKVGANIARVLDKVNKVSKKNVKKS